MTLTPFELVVLAAASIYGGTIPRHASPRDADELRRRSISDAMKLVREAEHVIEAEDAARERRMREMLTPVTVA